MKCCIPVLVALLAAVTSLATGVPEVSIREGDYESRPHFIIQAGDATWYYDRAGGGFSRLVDREGRDWIAFHLKPDQGPGGAAGKYRGLPNMVYGPDYTESGAGHPGFDHCTTELVDARTIRSTTRSGRWQWTWRFTREAATFTLDRADPAQPWWFIYEGPVGGDFRPRENFWGTDAGGPRREARNYKRQEEIAEAWRWTYFGRPDVARVLTIASLGDEPLPGVLGYLGATDAGLDAPDGMIVFGLGRDRSRPFRPLLHDAGRRFVVALLETTEGRVPAHSDLARRIEALRAGHR